jgi:vesicle-fusing ATPase
MSYPRDNFNNYGNRADQGRSAQNFSRPQQPPAGSSQPRFAGDGGEGRYSDSGSYGAAPARRPLPPSNVSQRSSGGGRRMQMTPIKNPGGNQFAFGNLVAISPLDFPVHEDIYLLLNGSYVVSGRPHQGCQPGEIGLTDPQRTWAGISLSPGEIVEVERYEPFRGESKGYIGEMAAEIGFAGRKVVEAPYDQDELAAHFRRCFENQILAPSQILVMDFKSVPLRIVIKAVYLVGLGGSKAEKDSASHPFTRGIITPETSMNFFKDGRSPINLKASLTRPATNAILQPNFSFSDLGIGGLDDQFTEIFRRAFASRLLPPGLIERMEMSHTKGILLYGPPGTGKTLLARQIGKALNAREPKIINGPEVLNKYVGQSEENIRKVFADAEKEWKEKGEESGLHLIIFDELDAVCKQRGSGGSSGGTGVGDNIVNQLLTIIDGVNSPKNFLMIGMTNRADLIDEALLRPGRLEVHIEVPLPNEAGRLQILNIHTSKLRKNGHLGEDVDLPGIAHKTRNYTGAELRGVLNAAGSHAYMRHIELGENIKVKQDVATVQVTTEDIEQGLQDVKAQFGADVEDLGSVIKHGIIPFSPIVQRVLGQCRELVNNIKATENAEPLKTVLISGSSGSGITALAAQVALDSEIAFVRLVSSTSMVGMSEGAKVAKIQKIFDDADKVCLITSAVISMLTG